MITPSFALTATERVLPKLALDFTTASLDSRVTFTRTTDATHPATYVNSSGVLTSATNNQPRFDYNPITLACKGLLIEESRTNSLTQSNVFDNAAWSKTGMLFGANATTSPDGTSNATKLIPDTTSSSLHRVYVLASGANAFSVYAKAGEYYGLRLFADGFDTVFNLSNGTVASGTGTITAAGNGWYRCSAAATITSAQIVVYPTTSTAQYTGNGTSGLYVYGAQLEAGAFPTSYIPTAGAALTRNADVATMTGTNFSDWYNTSEGTFTVQADTLAINQSNLTFLASTDASTGCPCVYLRNASDRINAGLTNVFGINAAGGAVTANSTFITSYGYKASSHALYVKATAAGTSSNATAPAACTLLTIGNAGSAYFWNGHIAKLNYYPQRLINAELAAFSK